jgi:hypothetical protein
MSYQDSWRRRFGFPRRASSKGSPEKRIVGLTLSLSLFEKVEPPAVLAAPL